MKLRCIEISVEPIEHKFFRVTLQSQEIPISNLDDWKDCVGEDINMKFE